jgi:hypothetical protein
MPRPPGRRAASLRAEPKGVVGLEGAAAGRMTIGCRWRFSLTRQDIEAVSSAGPEAAGSCIHSARLGHAGEDAHDTHRKTFRVRRANLDGESDSPRSYAATARAVRGINSERPMPTW